MLTQPFEYRCNHLGLTRSPSLVLKAIRRHDERYKVDGVLPLREA